MRRLVFLIFLWSLATAANGAAVNDGVQQRLGAALPRDAALVDEQGRPQTFGALLRGKPLVLVFAYYGCPNLCTFVLSDLVHGLAPLSLKAGDDFDVAIVSIDPKEGPELAAAKKAAYAVPAWHFLTGAEAGVRRLADAAGFPYEYDAANGQYRHPSAVVVLTPDGRVSRYLLGLAYKPRDLRLALVEASGGRIGTPVDQVLLLCAHFGELRGRYAAGTMAGVRVLGAATLVGLAAFLWRTARGREARPA